MKHKTTKSEENGDETFLFLAAMFKIEWTRVTFKFRLSEKIVLFNSELNLRFTMTDQNLTMSNNQFAKPMDWIKKNS